MAKKSWQLCCQMWAIIVTSAEFKKLKLKIVQRFLQLFGEEFYFLQLTHSINVDDLYNAKDYADLLASIITLNFLYVSLCSMKRQVCS